MESYIAERPAWGHLSAILTPFFHHLNEGGIESDQIYSTRLLFNRKLNSPECIYVPRFPTPHFLQAPEGYYRSEQLFIYKLLMMLWWLITKNNKIFTCFSCLNSHDWAPIAGESDRGHSKRESVRCRVQRMRSCQSGNDTVWAPDPRQLPDRRSHDSV